MKKIFGYIMILTFVSLAGLYFSKGEINLKKSNTKLLSDTVCFTRDILPIFISNCGMSGCHSSGSRGERADYTTYGGIMTGIKAGNPTGSKIYNIISSSGGEDAMPPPPRQRLSQAMLDLIKLWIQQGARNTSCTQANCDTTNIDYPNTIKPILAIYCLGCHSGSNPSGNVNLTNDSLVVQMKSSIAAAIHSTGLAKMPQGMDLDSCYIKQIDIWGREVQTTPCDTNNVTYAGTIKPILAQHCLSCHTGPYALGGTDLTNDSVVFANKTVIYGSVANLPGYHLMPQGTQLSPCEVAQIRIWNESTVSNVAEYQNGGINGIKIYPNPSNSYIKIIYSINYYSNVMIDIINLNGAVLSSVYSGLQSPGSHEINYDGVAALSSGTYFCRITGTGKTYFQKFVINK